MKRKHSRSMQKAWWIIDTRGFLLVEVMLAIAVFLLLISVFTGAYLYGQESQVHASNRARAMLLAEEGLEAARNIKDARFGNLMDGAYGLAISGNTWILSGPSDITDIFTRTLTISSVNDTRKNITATIAWQQNPQRAGMVSLTTRLTNWQETSNTPVCDNQASQLIIHTDGAELAGGNKELHGIILENTHTSCDITIAKITPTWTNTKHIEEIKIDESRVWKYNNEGSPDGKQISGVQLDIVDTVLAKEAAKEIDKIVFDGTMSGASFTLTFMMDDGTTTSSASFLP